MPVDLHICGLSDIGTSRLTNQDVWAAQEDLGFFVLADGMGGRKAGDIAARMTVLSLCDSIRSLSEKTNCFESGVDISKALRYAIEQTNKRVYRMSHESESLSGMGSTLCCILWTDAAVHYAHVGDSRIYRYRDGQLQSLTKDHSLFAKWLSQKTPSQPSPPKHIITRAIGIHGHSNPEVGSCEALPGDLFLLCSDGLTDTLELEDIQEILHHPSSLQKAAATLIDCAKNMGSHDNITVLMVQLQKEGVTSNGLHLSRQ